MSEWIVLSHVQVAPLLRAQREGRGVATTSLDLGLSEVEAVTEADPVVLAGEVILAWHALEEIAQERNACFLVEDHEVSRIQAFSEHTNLFYGLLPTDSAPTLMISGVPMHRIKDTKPWLDSRPKLQALGRISGQVLDTCAGLGTRPSWLPEKHPLWSPLS